MLTSRGWWLLLIAGTILVLGVVWLGRFSALPPLIGASVLCWLAWGAMLFHHRLAAGAEHLSVTRVLLQRGRPTPVLWAGGKATVRVGVRNEGTTIIPLARLSDRLPGEIFAAPEGSEFETALKPGETATFEYDIAVEAPGVLRFAGVAVRIADLEGFFYNRRFLHAAVDVLVLPVPVDHDGRRRDVKRFNVLPPPGVHRLRRAGSGDELHDLRDYRPGDSPKMIAWKASARRDRLIIKELESDVPVRCVLFVDAASDGFDGFSKRSIATQLVELSAGILQAAGANRDLVGLTIFQGDGATTTTLPARSKIHTLKLLEQLSEAAGRIPEPAATSEAIARTAYTTAQELFPERLERGVNARPLGLFWLPISDSRWFYLLVAFMVLPLLLSRRFALEFLADVAGTFAPASYSWAVFLALAVLPGTLAGLLWFFHGIRGLLMPRSRRTSRRKQLALLFAADDRDSPAAVERYLHDDEWFRIRASAFLVENRIRMKPTIRSAVPNAALVSAAAEALARAVGRARDTEVYVLLLDLLERAEDLGGLAAAVRTARARKHRVLIVVPRPKDLGDDRASILDVSPGDLKLPVLLKLALASQLQRNYERIRRELTRAGAVVMRADEGDTAALILQRLDEVRTARIRR